MHSHKHQEAQNYQEVTFEPAVIPEWDVADDVLGVLGGSTTPADDAESKAMLDSLQIALPDKVKWTTLREKAAQRKIPLELPRDQAHKDFFLAEVPLSIIQTGKYHLVKLGLQLNLETTHRSQDVVAYDLFPKNTLDVKTIASGEAKIDISKALNFALPIGKILSDCLQLNLSVPFTWKSSTLTVQVAGLMSQKANWLVMDCGMQEGTFSGSVIIRVPKGARPAMKAELACELRHKGLGRIIRGRFRTPPEKHYYSFEA
jgi:hypothetical protein